MYIHPNIMKRPKTKIVCTLGPATTSEESIQTLVENGMSVARLNMSHGSLEEHIISAQRVRQVSERVGIPVGIMVDVPGTKYRTGPLGPGALVLKRDERITLTSRDVVGTQELVSVAPPGIHRDAVAGRPLLLDDGLLELEIIEVRDQDVLCKIVRGGRLTERRGVATPGRSPSLPFPDEKAIQALEFAADVKADFVAVSMVTTEETVRAARAVVEERGLNPYIISKIESPEAVEHFDSILTASDGAMVARGDLGVELPISDVPIIQKDLILKCNIQGKPVITATQMLESMTNSPVPTRAEVTDVANAVFDGTDAIMLSGETSIGQYPAEAVKMMAEVAMKTEAALPYERIILDTRRRLQRQTDDAIAYDACQTAQQLDVGVIVAFTEAGITADRVSKYRPMPPILALTPYERVQKRLTLRWGVIPVVVGKLDSVEELFAAGEEQAVKIAGVKPGGLIIVVAGVPIGVSRSTNLLRVLTVSLPKT